MTPRCVLRRQSVAIFALHVSQKAPRTGKAPLPGNISPPCIQNELTLARFARHVSEKPCKSPSEDASREYLARKEPFLLHRPLESCTTRESCHSWVFRLGVAGEERGEAGRGVPAQRMRLAHAPALCEAARVVELVGASHEGDTHSPVAASVLWAKRRHRRWAPHRVAASARLAACVQLLLARGFITPSTLRSKRRDRVVYRRKRGAVMVFR